MNIHDLITVIKCKNTLGKVYVDVDGIRCVYESLVKLLETGVKPLILHCNFHKVY